MKRKHWYALAIIILMAGGGTAVYYKTRGLRNNNPGNIRESAGDRTQWVGERATDDDPAFEEFVSPEHGIRALAITLMNYQRLYGLDTVQGLINRWAPDHENPTGAYVQHVAKYLGVSPGQKIVVRKHLVPLVESIIKFENGVQPYPASVINAGIRMAV